MTRAQTTATTQQNTAGATPPFLAGKNKIINGDFGVNQRGFSSTTTHSDFTFDRWTAFVQGGTCTFTSQTFTTGTAPVAGYESKNFIQIAVASQSSSSDYAAFGQRIEGVRTFANQTVTVSFWARATSGTPKISIELDQIFGTGGSPSAQVNNDFGNVTLSTSWARYSVTSTVPSISGKTIGTSGNDYLLLWMWLSAGSAFNSRTQSMGLQNNTFQIWGIQVEAGSVATPFTTATGTIQGELAACQRYYFRLVATENAYSPYGVGQVNTSTQANAWIQHPVPMRVKASSLDYSTVAFTTTGGGVTAGGTLFLNYGSNTMTAVASTNTSGLVAGQATALLANNSTSSYVGLNAEL